MSKHNEYTGNFKFNLYISLCQGQIIKTTLPSDTVYLSPLKSWDNNSFLGSVYYSDNWRIARQDYLYKLKILQPNSG